MACTERVMLKETYDSKREQDAEIGPPIHTPLDVGDGSRKSGDPCKVIDELKEFHRNSAEVIILLDRSLAMQQSFGSSTKLGAVQDSLRTAISTYQSSIRFGFIEYPGPNSQTDCDDKSCCANKVQVKPGLNSLRDMEGWMRCETSSYPCPIPTTDTPLHFGLASISNSMILGNSFEYSRSQWNSSDNSQYIFLFAAADAACSGKNSVCSDALNQVKNLASLDIRIITFTIGWIPSASSCMAKIIQATPSSNSFKKFFSIEKEADLNTLFEFLLTSLSRESCELKLEDPVNRPGQLVVTFDDIPIARDLANGWFLNSNQHASSIRFYGQACDALRSTPSIAIKIIDKCSTCSGSESCRL
jgi:hypothetical protein